MKTKSRWLQILRVALALVGLFGWYRLVVNSARSGYSRLLSTVSIASSNVEPADYAVRMVPRDPEAHYTRGLSLVNLNRLSDAVVEFREAVRLRPHHYYQWLDLGVTLDRLNDQAGALAALNESVRLAPAFAQPRWQLGSLLFREGKFDEAFDELRLAANSNPAFFENLLDLAWVAANGDVAKIESLLKPQNPQSHLVLANYLAKRGKGADAVRHVNDAGSLSVETDRALARQTIKELINTKQFSDAYLAWALIHNAPRLDATGQILNGYFKDPISQNDPGFGWQLLELPSLSASLDPSGAVPDSRSLLLEFRGDQPPGSPLVSQLILVKPAAKYSLSFMERTESVVTGGPPMVVILDAGNQDVLGQSSPIAIGTHEWKASQIDFSSKPEASAVVIILRRLDCTESPCPIFGKLWLSAFALAKK
jgi:tetratricopeptide (TPR) repeat protein